MRSGGTECYIPHVTLTALARCRARGVRQLFVLPQHYRNLLFYVDFFSIWYANQAIENQFGYCQTLNEHRRLGTEVPRSSQIIGGALLIVTDL